MSPTATAIRACTSSRPNGRLLLSWGAPGTDPGEFNIAHNITCDADGWVYVADRENHRVQVFDGNGRYETQWNNLHRPCGLFMPPGKCPICYIGELGAVQPVSRNVPNLGPRVTIVDNTGKRIARLGGLGPGLGPTEFMAPHGLTVDSRGDLYVGEVSWTNWPQTFKDQPRPDEPAFAAQVPQGVTGSPGQARAGDTDHWPVIGGHCRSAAPDHWPPAADG